MRKTAVFLAAYGFLSVCFASAVVLAADSFSQEGVKSRGVIFNVAEDRRIDYVNGYQEPESIDKYIKRKFEDVNLQLKVVNEKLDKIAASLDAKAKK